MTDEPKPEPFTAFIAWHPRHGYEPNKFGTKTQVWEHLAIQGSNLCEALCVRSVDQYKQGWRVIRVRVTPDE